MVKLPHTPTGVQSLKNTNDLTMKSLDRKHIHPTPCNHYFLSHFKGTETVSNLICGYSLYVSFGFKTFQWVAQILKSNFTLKSRFDSVPRDCSALRWAQWSRAEAAL